ncbi:MAG: shikimate dehydrogenase [Verrucomicrobia bacterium]|nr:shikimate dehydrogenase [Verrucomicrobiota bacterium]
MKLLDFNRIGARTRYCGVLGHPIGHSGSPAMHNPAMMAMGLDWNYLAFDVLPENLADVLRGAMWMGFVGLNLTVPHKLLACDLVDHLDVSAQPWGAVNTIRFEGLDADGHWKPLWKCRDSPTQRRMTGFNTDANAVIRAIREELELPVSGNSVLVLGAGGAGRVASLKLASESVSKLFLVNRTQSRCETIRQEIQQQFPTVEVMVGYPPAHQKIDLVVNATSLGLRSDDDLPWDKTQFQLNNAANAYDMIYQPAETPFLKAAREAGCRTSNGLGMLLYQGVAALEIWTERHVPTATMREALMSHIYRPSHPHS